MDWTRQIDGYCERTDPGYWAEPVNAATNAAFLIAAFILWRRTAGMPLARALCGVLALIGAGSYLFHTHATVWAMAMDVGPILIFGLIYLYGANRAYLGWPVWAALTGMAGFIPFALGVGLATADIPFLRISSVYWAYPILFFGYAALLRPRARGTAMGLAMAGALLSLSITLRSIDETLCQSFPLGTHFLWHILNALVLGWVIEVYRRHLLAHSMT